MGAFRNPQSAIRNSKSSSPMPFILLATDNGPLTTDKTPRLPMLFAYWLPARGILPCL